MLIANRQRGFTYLTILFVIAFMGVGMAYVGQLWHTAAMREREAELLFVGNQYRKAIERYYRSGPPQYPRSLSDLLKDPRKPGIERYLRRAYADPMTGKEEWGILKAPDGGVMGIYSLSEAKPFKRTNFRMSDKDFESAARYADWKFVYLPLGPAAAPQPGVKPVPGQTAPGTTAAPAQAVPGSALPGGTISPAPGSFGSSSSGSSPFGSGSFGSGSFGSGSQGQGSLLPGSPAPSSPAPSPKPFLMIQPIESSPSPAQPSTSMQPAPGTSDAR